MKFLAFFSIKSLQKIKKFFYKNLRKIQKFPDKPLDRSTYANESGTIDLDNVKLIRIMQPKPGKWKVRTSSRVKNTLRIFGHGEIDFKYGFASRPTANIDLVRIPAPSDSGGHNRTRRVGLDRF